MNKWRIQDGKDYKDLQMGTVLRLRYENTERDMRSFSAPQKGTIMNEYFKNVNTGVELSRDEYVRLIARDIAEFATKFAEEIIEESDDDADAYDIIDALSERLKDIYYDDYFDHYVWDDDNQHYVNWGRC